MQWSELIQDLSAALQAALPDYKTAIGAWARVPNTDSAHIQLARIDIEQNRYRTLRLHIDLFIQPPAEIDDTAATAEKLEAAQTVVENVCVTALPALGALSVTLQSWENDGGVFLPTWGSRLSLALQVFAPAIATPVNMGCYAMPKPTNFVVTYQGETDVL